MALAGLTALTDLKLAHCFNVSEDVLRALVGLTGLTDFTSLNLDRDFSECMSDFEGDGSQALTDFDDMGDDSEDHHFYGYDGHDGYESEGELYDW